MVSGHSVTGSTNITHREISTTASFLAVQNGTMDIGEHGVSTRNIMLKFRNDGMCVHDPTVNLGGDYVCIHCKFGLEVPG